MKFPHSYLRLALIVAVVAVGFAVLTQHVWEDYYITFRASKNLVLGHGLTFNPGEKVHTFTSPLGVLLPALSAAIVGADRDMAALWLFRFMSIGALAGAALLVMNVARRWSWPTPLAMLAGVLVVIEGKTLDFSINGMEAAFLVFFMAYALWAHVRGARSWWHQGIAWAGLMWSRPDSFIYIAVLALAVGVFGLVGEAGEDRKKLIVSWLKAGLLTTVLYLPWFLWAWHYYGTPVPHTVAAKSGFMPEFSMLAWLENTGLLLGQVFNSGNTLAGTWLPSYHEMGGWHPLLIKIGQVMGVIAGFAWLLPKVSRGTRVCSLMLLGVHAYLSFFPYYCFPWYYPAGTVFAVLALLGLLWDWRQALAGTRFWHRAGDLIFLVPLLITLLFTGMMAVQMRAQQHFIEDGVRTQIGLYLKEHADPEDTVFLEPLGYIGYFSNLRTYDFPGMSSPEMVSAREVVGNDWRELIHYLRPSWIVIRPKAFERIHHGVHDWSLETRYEKVRVFSQAEALAEVTVPGKNYLLFDQTFWLYRRKQIVKRDAGEGWVAESDYGVKPEYIGLHPILFAHAEADLSFEIPEDTKRIKIGVSFSDKSWNDPVEQTDGVHLVFQIRQGPSITFLGADWLEPAINARDRGVQHYYFTLPERTDSEATLCLGIQSHKSKTRDWVQVHLPEFE